MYVGHRGNLKVHLPSCSNMAPFGLKKKKQKEREGGGDDYRLNATIEVLH